MFLDKFFKDDPRRQPRKSTKLVIKHDEWDMGDLNRIMDEMKELSNADDRLTDFTPTGHEAMVDTFFSLYKALPKMEDSNNVRASHMVNYRVMQEAQALSEHQKLRTYSSTDIVASGLAAVSMEPELEILFDKLKDEQEQASKIGQMLDQLEGMQEDQESAEEMLAKALEDENEKQAENWQNQIGKIEAGIEQLQQQIEDATGKLQEDLNAKGPQIGQGMKAAMDKAIDQAENIDSLSNSWGLEPGTIKRMNADKRIELARRINNEKFKKIAELIGPMQRLAMSEQSKKLEFAKDEIYDLELGDDIEHVLPEELLMMTDEDFEMLFYKNFFEQNLMQFKLQGTEKIAKGGIIFCEDGSGSMSGSREVWAKAVGLALLQIARSQNREFYGIHFCGPNVYKTFDFDYKSRKVETFDYRGHKDQFDELDGVLDYAETFFSGGTDFVTPLNLALTKLGEQFDKGGKIKGDIVFCTDGMCGVPPAFLEKLAEEKERLGVRIFGIILDGSEGSEPLATICDNRVFTIKDLISGRDIRHVFRDV